MATFPPCAVRFAEPSALRLSERTRYYRARVIVSVCRNNFVRDREYSGYAEACRNKNSVRTTGG